MKLQRWPADAPASGCGGKFLLTLCAKRPNIHRMIANATFTTPQPT
jgi:hypothetical protein